MGQTTGIEFADSTVNGMMGCDGCELWPGDAAVRAAHPERRICYAGVITEKILASGPLRGWPESFDRPELFPGRIEKTVAWKDLAGTRRPAKPWLDGMPRIIFCDDMGDRWTASLPADSLAPTLPHIARAPHIYLFFTKRPDRAADFFAAHRAPDNLWLATTITSRQDARLRALLRCRVAVHAVSYEPILADAEAVVQQFPGVDWWIFGGASGPNAPETDVAIIRAGVRACREVGAAAFVKQLGARAMSVPPPPPAGRYVVDGPGQLWRLSLRHPKGGDWDEWSEANGLADLCVRQYPNMKGA